MGCTDVRSRLLKPLVDSCVEVFLATSSTLLPTPSKSHYTFNFRDVVKVMQVCAGIVDSRNIKAYILASLPLSCAASTLGELVLCMYVDAVVAGT